MANINGTSFTVYIPTDPVASDSSTTDWMPVAGSKTCTLNINMGTTDATTKSSAGWMEHSASTKSWDGTFDGLVDFDISGFGAGSETEAGVLDVYDYLAGRNKIRVAVGVDGQFFYGDAHITGISMSADHEQDVTYSGTFEGTGALSKSTVADIDAANAYVE